MSVTITEAEGVTMFTITSNPKSKCPLICQLLGTLCYSPACVVPKDIKQRLGKSQTALGTLQILVGLMNIGIGCIFRVMGDYSMLWDAYFWMATVFIVAGILCILAEKFPGMCLLSFTVLVNLTSAAVAITAIVFYTCDLPGVTWPFHYGCSYYYYTDTLSPERTAQKEICERFANTMMMLHGGVSIMMIVLSVLQLCVTISSCVLILKALCKKNRGEETKDPERYQPLLEEVHTNPAC